MRNICAELQTVHALSQVPLTFIHAFLAGCRQVLELDTGNAVAAAKAAKLQPIVEQRREKMKDEMIGESSPEPPPLSCPGREGGLGHATVRLPSGAAVRHCCLVCSEMHGPLASALHQSPP